MDKKTVQNVAICRKAGNLVCGFDAVKNGLAVTRPKIGPARVSAVLLTADASDKTAKEITFFAAKTDTPAVRCGFTSDEIAAVLGKRCTVLGVRGENFIKMMQL